MKKELNYALNLTAGLTLHDGDIGATIFGAEWEDKFVVFPIPLSEIDRTAGLIKQNTGY